MVIVCLKCYRLSRPFFQKETNSMQSNRREPCRMLLNCDASDRSLHVIYIYGKGETFFIFISRSLYIYAYGCLCAQRI